MNNFQFYYESTNLNFILRVRFMYKVKQLKAEIYFNFHRKLTKKNKIDRKGKTEGRDRTEISKPHHTPFVIRLTLITNHNQMKIRLL